MRKIELRYINISGVRYPVHCDAYVMEQLQEEWEIAPAQFEREIKGLYIIKDKDGHPQYDEEHRLLQKVGTPRIRTVMLGLWLMLREGCLIEEEQGGESIEIPMLSELKRVCDVSTDEITELVIEEFDRCYGGGKKKEEQKPKRKRRN